MEITATFTACVLNIWKAKRPPVILWSRNQDNKKFVPSSWRQQLYMRSNKNKTRYGSVYNIILGLFTLFLIFFSDRVSEKWIIKCFSSLTWIVATGTFPASRTGLFYRTLCSSKCFLLVTQSSNLHSLFYFRTQNPVWPITPQWCE